jgi:hypothetical protein
MEEELRAIGEVTQALHGGEPVEQGLASLLAVLRGDRGELAFANRLQSEFLGSRVPERASGFSVPWWIVLMTAVVGAVCIAASAVSITGGNYVWLNLAFRYPGGLLLICLAGAELRLAIAARERFGPGDLLRPAWTLVAAAGAAHLCGELMTQVFAEGCITHPALAALPGAEAVRRAGLTVGGPLRCAILAIGLGFVVRAALRSGLLPRLTATDAAMVLASGVFAVLQLHEATHYGDREYSVHEIAGFATDPLLTVLLAEALLTRRLLRNLGWERLARCWTAVAAGSALTTLGDIGIWASWHNFLPWPWSATQWFVWFLASAAFALGPACQLQAARDTVPLRRVEVAGGEIAGKLARPADADRV